MADSKINSTKPVSDKGGQLSESLNDMKEYDMNVLNDPISDAKKGKK